jgi:hypothetical protein
MRVNEDEQPIGSARSPSMPPAPPYAATPHAPQSRQTRERPEARSLLRRLQLHPPRWPGRLPWTARAGAGDCSAKAGDVAPRRGECTSVCAPAPERGRPALALAVRGMQLTSIPQCGSVTQDSSWISDTVQPRRATTQPMPRGRCGPPQDCGAHRQAVRVTPPRAASHARARLKTARSPRPLALRAARRPGGHPSYRVIACPDHTPTM